MPLKRPPRRVMFSGRDPYPVTDGGNTSGTAKRSVEFCLVPDIRRYGRVGRPIAHGVVGPPTLFAIYSKPLDHKFAPASLLASPAAERLLWRV